MIKDPSDAPRVLTEREIIKEKMLNFLQLDS
jgi:hypothetical protein